MQVVVGDRSLRIYILVFTSLQLWGRLSASTASPTLPAPTLGIYSRSKDSVVLICKVPKGLHGALFMLYRAREKVDSQELQSGAEEVQFIIRVEKEIIGELFCCLYKSHEGRYSAFSPYLRLEHLEHQQDMLPLPTLVLQQQTEVWHLICTGSPSYPGAVFSLYLAESKLPIATYHAKAIHHQATFPVPVQDTPVVLYQCQYSVLLGKKWSDSERSPALPVTRGTQPPSDFSGVDWPLVLGSFSAVVLFLCSVVLVAVLAHKKVKAAAEKKKKREEEQYWTQINSKDHTVELTLRHSSFPCQDWAGGDTETACRSSAWNCHSTFTSPNHLIH